MNTPDPFPPALTELPVLRKTLDRALAAVAGALTELEEAHKEDSLSQSTREMVAEGRVGLEILSDAFARAAPAGPAQAINTQLLHALTLLADRVEWYAREKDDIWLAVNTSEARTAIAAAAAVPAPPPAPSGVRHYLEASTIHLSPSDLRLLESCPGVLAYPYPEGAWVYVSDDEADQIASLLSAGWTSAMAEILAYAHASGCYWIRLDRDADPIPGLPVYEHE